MDFDYAHLKRLWLAAVAAFAVSCDGASTGPIPHEPNIILIVTDDLDWGSMPHLDRLRDFASQGLTFDNFFVTYSTCTPSRVSILRGQYPHNHGVIANHPPHGGFPRLQEVNSESSTLATWLESAGYRTVLFGKYVGYYPSPSNLTYVPPGWTEWYATYGNDHYDFTINENGELVDYPCCERYQTDVVASIAADFIGRAARDDVPFFMYLATRAPHRPEQPAPRHIGSFAGRQAPRPPSFNEADVSDKPSLISKRRELTPEAMERRDVVFRDRLEMMLAVEEMIDTLLLALEGADLTDQTYLFFTSDNGYHYGEHRLNHGKGTAYDEDIRVPLLVSGPGIRSGRSVHRIALNIDLAPTIAELAGVSPPSFVDGRSIVPLLFGRVAADSWRQGFLVQRWRPFPDSTPTNSYRLHAFRGFRTAHDFYVEWDTDEFEFYDRDSDPFELENMYESVDPVVKARLDSWLERLGSCAGSSCRSIEDQGW